LIATITNIFDVAVAYESLYKMSSKVNERKDEMSLFNDAKEPGSKDEPSNNTSPLSEVAPNHEGSGFIRSIGLLQATAINMTQMCGIGPFITIPVMVAALGGPQAILGWIAGAILALADGLIWAELGAAMPGAGGTYLYLREAFQYRSGRLMPFLFIWTAMLSIPLIMSTGVIGLVQYLGFLLPGMNWLDIHLISILVVVIVVFALYRRIESIGLLSTLLWIIMIISVGLVIIASFTHFSPHLAFTYPAGAFSLNGHFFIGLGAGLLIGIYDYLGYNTTAYMGGEIRNPGRVLPLSIIFSILGMMVLYLAMNIGVVGVVPWQAVASSSSVASLVLEHTWGHGLADVVTVLILITAFASVFAGLLGGSRVPYNAARDGLFLRIFDRLHPRYHFPYIALLVMGVITAIGSFFNLTTVINMLLAVSVLVQSVAQVAALTVLRRRQPSLRRPYREWLYPVPSIIAFFGWLYVYFSSGILSIALSLSWIVVGIIAFLIWARIEHFWPFGKKEIHEDYNEPLTSGEERKVA
jgi:amino acid transporter